jgi:ATP-dependent helicase/nuclease subunit B
MGQSREEADTDAIDACLRAGGRVVAASERAARSLTTAFHRARRAEGLTAWPAPRIQDWRSFVHDAWNERSLDGRVVLNPLQEQSLWAGIVAASAPQATQVEGSRHRLASMAMDAHSLLCDYSPRLLKQNARSGWDQDAGAFSGWLAMFDEACQAGNLISTARLPLELIAALEADSSARQPLLLAGFDRILPTQMRLFDAWGSWSEAPGSESASKIEYHEAVDESTELAACALWCKSALATDADARLLVVTQDVAKRRGEIERAFLRFAPSNKDAPGSTRNFEFSLGVPLGQIALARGASLLLHWLDGAIEEHELDWLLSNGQAAGSLEESRALTGFMRALRRRGMQRTRWTLTDFVGQRIRVDLPAAWVRRMIQARNRLQEVARRPQTPLAWAELAPQLLEIAGWPGGRSLTSAEFQAHRRWQQAVDDCASLGFDGRRMGWKDFLATLDRTVDETLFASESQDAPILIAGPAETAGLTADAIWFLGASEDGWPASGATHPLLPLPVQREAGMPHASAQLDWELADAITRRMIASAGEVHFSYARQVDGVDVRPSRIIMQIVGPAQRLTNALTAGPLPITIPFADASQIPFPHGSASGGAGVLTAQSQCAFKAFATGRLGAQDWEPAEAGLTAAERGQLLHAVLHAVWGGPPDGIRTHAELAAVSDLTVFVASHVRRVIQEEMPARARQSMPRRYLELEETRLTGLVTEWLRYESARASFAVVETETRTAATIAGLTLDVRLDRIDRLKDGSVLVIDYKSGDVSPKCWDLPRPDDVQLPLYAGFALDHKEGPLGGIVFAKIRVGNNEFLGRVKDARGKLLNDLNSNCGLVQNSLNDEELTA